MTWIKQQTVFFPYNYGNLGSKINAPVYQYVVRALFLLCIWLFNPYATLSKSPSCITWTNCKLTTEMP